MKVPWFAKHSLPGMQNRWRQAQSITVQRPICTLSYVEVIVSVVKVRFWGKGWVVLNAAGMGKTGFRTQAGRGVT